MPVLIDIYREPRHWNNNAACWIPEAWVGILRYVNQPGTSIDFTTKIHGRSYGEVIEAAERESATIDPDLLDRQVAAVS